MKQSFVKMMNRISEIENCILKGLVLDEHGNWVTISDRKAVEEDSLAHLAAGQVLFEGRWVNFTEVKLSRTRSIEKPPLIGGIAAAIRRKKKVIVETPAAPAAPSSPGKKAEPVPAPPETAIIVQSPPPEEETRMVQPSSVKTPVPRGEAPAFPPETTIIDQPTSRQETLPPPERAAGEEEFAPETKIILFKPPPEAAPPAAAQDTSEIFLTDLVTGATVQDEDTHIFLMPAVVPLVESGHKRRQKILLIGSVIVMLAGIAAILTILFQSAQ